MNFSTDHFRKYYFWLIQLTGLTVIVLTLVHIFEYRGGFGGRDNPKNEFCWHILFMTLGFSYFLANGLVAFRTMPIMSKKTLKLIHFGIFGAVIICAVLGLFFVIDERDIVGKAHFTSLHSWLGIAAIALLVFQFLAGAFVYLSPTSPPTLRERLMPFHVKCGQVIFLLGVGSIITGLKKGSTETERLVVNFTGASVVILCFLVLHVVTTDKYKYSFRLR